MEKLAEGAYMDRLVVTEDVDGRLSTHILRYRPSGDWLAMRASGETGWEAYTGEIAIFDGEGDPKAAGHFNGGQVTAQDTGKGTAGKSDEMDCTITDISMGGVQQGDTLYVTDIIIEYECSGSGTNDGDDDPDPGLDNGGGEFPQDEGPQGGGGGGGGNGEQIPTIIDDELVFDNISNNLTNPCASDIFNELQSGIYTQDILKPEIEVVVSENDILDLNFAEYVLHLFNNIENINYTIQNGNLGGTNANTTGSTTTIDNNYLGNATQLSTARTMIHELVHAYLNLHYHNPLSLDNGMDFRLKMEKYAIDNGYKPNGNSLERNVFHHNFMGQYISAMAYALYEWDKEHGTGNGINNISGPEDLLGWDYYRSMAFSGQFMTDGSGNITSTSNTFEELVPNGMERQQIANIVFNELKGNNDAQGTECD